jgi:hypothetical protein
MGFKNEVSYSASSAEMLNVCPRQYYYSRYASWNGWWNGKRPPESKRSEEVYIAKHATSAPAWAGDLVHRQAQRVLNEARDGAKWEHAELLRNSMLTSAAAEIDLGLRQAKTETQGNPKKRLQLVEMLYGLPFDEEAFRNRVRTRINLLAGPDESWEGDIAGKNLLFHALSRSNRIVFVEELLNFKMLDVKIYVKCDLIMRGVDARNCVIIDWKTGQPKETDTAQLRLYEQWATARAWNSVELLLVYIGEQSVTVKRVKTNGNSMPINGAIAAFKENLSKRLVDGDLNRNEPVEKLFEPTSNASACKYCPFQGICARDGTKPSI